MGKDLKETPYAAAAKAEISQIAPGQAPQPPGDSDAPHHRLPALQEPAAGPSRLPGVRDLPGPRGHHPPESRTGKLTTSAGADSAFLHFSDHVRRDRAFVFPGQGAQAVGMGQDLYDAYPVARELYDRADEIVGFPLSKLCFEGPEDELQQTRNAQPAIAVTSLALLKVATLETPGLLDRPAFVAGHSLGEYPALVAAGAISFDTAIRLLRSR